MSYTEAEYREAKRRNIPVIVLLKAGRDGRWVNAEVSRRRRGMLERFAKVLREETWVRTYRTRAELAVEGYAAGTPARGD